MYVNKSQLLVLAISMAMLLGAGQASAQTVRAVIGTSPPTGGDPPGGLCYEVLTAIGEMYGWDLQFAPTSGLTAMLDAVTGSTADVACSGIVPNTDRRNMGLAFTGPIFTNSEFLYVRGDDMTGYTSLSELAGKRVAGQEGSTFLRAMEKAGLNDVMQLPNNDAGMAALASGEIDAYVTGVQSRYLTDVEKSITDVRSVETYVPVMPLPSAFAVRKTDTELLGQLQAGLEALKTDSTLNDLVSKWSLQPPQF